MKLKPITGIIGAQLAVQAPPSLFKDLQKLFTFDNPQYLAILKYSPYARVSPRVAPEVKLWTSYDDYTIFVPRGINSLRLSKSSYQLWNRIKWIDERNFSPVVFPKCQIKLNKEQQFLVNNFRILVIDKKECPFGNVLYVAPTSSGKTITQAKMAEITGQRTLVLCLTEQIKRAWYGDLRKAYGLVEKEIGLIQQKKWFIGDYFTLASVKTLIKRKAKWDELFKQIGTVIVDEAHTITGRSVHNFLLACPAAFLIGATATDRGEGPSKFYLPAILGKVRKRIIAQQRDTQTSLALRDVVTINTQFRYKVTTDILNWHDMSQHMALDEGRNQLIVKSAYKDWSKGESVLLVTKRLAHVHILLDMCREYGIEDANILTGETNSDRLYSEKLVQAILARKVRCLIATIAAIKLGANLNPLSVLHLTMPVANKRDLEQLIGRIRRRAVAKQTCILKYYWDVEMPYLRGLFKRVGVPVFRKLQVPRYKRLFMA
jgi:superfamily II DNA or RNA helicase